MDSQGFYLFQIDNAVKMDVSNHLVIFSREISNTTAPITTLNRLLLKDPER